MRAGYQDSFAALKDRVDIIGEPQPSVTRPPRHDDEVLGPSMFRLRVADVSLENLTLRGLFVGRSTLKSISFRDSDLQLSAFNWSDIVDCDFSGADLKGADLRACRFERCSFRGADLSGSDLRISSFDRCLFEGASLRGARLRRRPKALGFLKTGPDQTGLALSDAQRSDVEWCPDAPEPGGG
jgi:uncharacterized protein YjbI with pentapeptide repeats